MEEETNQQEQTSEENASQNQPTKQERRLQKKEAKQEERQAAVNKKKTKKVFYLAIGIALLVFGGWYISTREVAPLPGEKIADLGNQHIAGVNTEHAPYNSTPPTSGPHTDNLAPWGISDRPLDNENQVHNLEDGGVGVQYNCPDGCEDLINQLTSIVDGLNLIFMAPYDNMEHTIALTAWGRIDTFDDYDEKRIRSFIKAYRGIDHHKR